MTDLDAIRGRCDAADESAVVAAAEAWVERAESVGMTEGDTRKYYINLMEKAEDHFRATLSAALSARDNAIDGLAKALEECAAPIPGFMGKSSDDILTAVLVEFRRRTEQARAQLAMLSAAPAAGAERAASGDAREVDDIAKLICGHAAVDECNDVESYFAAATHHSGDCTNECHTCILCRVELYRDLARQILAHSQAAVARERAECAKVARTFVNGIGGEGSLAMPQPENNLAALAEAWVDAAAAYENAPSTGKFAAGYNAVRAAKTAFIQALAAKDAEIARLREAPGNSVSVPAVEREVCEEIKRIMQTYREQEAERGYVDTPGGLEHMGDVWRLLSEWDDKLRAAPPHDARA